MPLLDVSDYWPNNAVVVPNLEKIPNAPTLVFVTVFWTAPMNRPAPPIIIVFLIALPMASCGSYATSTDSVSGNCTPFTSSIVTRSLEWTVSCWLHTISDRLQKGQRLQVFWNWSWRRFRIDSVVGCQSWCRLIGCSSKLYPNSFGTLSNLGKVQPSLAACRTAALFSRMHSRHAAVHLHGMQSKIPYVICPRNQQKGRLRGFVLSLTWSSVQLEVCYLWDTRFTLHTLDT